MGLLRFLILEKGVDPNLPNRAGDTPLHTAIRSKREAAALFLISKAGCDCDALNSS